MSKIEKDRPELADKIKKFEHFKLEENLIGDVNID
jgi:hypothetical protein